MLQDLVRQSESAFEPLATMKDGSPFGLAGLWQNWKNPTTRKWERTFAIITVPSNELVSHIHDRTPGVKAKHHGCVSRTNVASSVVVPTKIVLPCSVSDGA
jgi:hypothetical protein